MCFKTGEALRQALPIAAAASTSASATCGEKGWHRAHSSLPYALPPVPPSIGARVQKQNLRGRRHHRRSPLSHRAPIAFQAGPRFRTHAVWLEGMGLQGDRQARARAHSSCKIGGVAWRDATTATWPSTRGSATCGLGGRRQRTPYIPSVQLRVPPSTGGLVPRPSHHVHHRHQTIRLPRHALTAYPMAWTTPCTVKEQRAPAVSSSSAGAVT